MVKDQKKINKHNWQRQVNTNPYGVPPGGDPLPPKKEVLFFYPTLEGTSPAKRRGGGGITL